MSCALRKRHLSHRASVTIPTENIYCPPPDSLQIHSGSEEFTVSVADPAWIACSFIIIVVSFSTNLLLLHFDFFDSKLLYFNSDIDKNRLDFTVHVPKTSDEPDALRDLDHSLSPAKFLLMMSGFSRYI